MRALAESSDATIKPADFSQIAASAGYKERSPSIYVREEGALRDVLLRNSDGTWTHLRHSKGGGVNWLVLRGRNWADLFRHVSEFHGLEW